MITQVLPIKVPEVWVVARPGVMAIASKAGASPEGVSAELLKRCCAGVMQLWLVADEAGVCGFFITELVNEGIMKTKALNIFLLYLYKPISKEIIEEGTQVINSFAKGNGCGWITFTTDTTDVVVLIGKWWPGWELRPSLRRVVE